ncbi:3-beta hydroxysteroid dehydrogenase [Streptomyces tateyamensis]|uniref:3-beta hydroxysteroid dehydrogenase n=1 Tax=Streptomyces tateyamensis TaxID=565073 RepID=A0A2V4MX63_9ACTN|nr:SDR family oxidoreductase [Streptomyces tateyamensis]PYC66657.1 3-beta hydroxysteroid dehydrogenase [Streptomyces tateyamensis]
MRVFVTGATGHIGSAVVPELLSAGHQVVGLTRTEAGADALTALGAEPLLATLDDLDTLRAAAREADGVIHLAFRHDLLVSGDYARATAIDLEVIRALGSELAGKVFVGTSGTGASATPGTPVTEDDPKPDAAPRGAAENTLLRLADTGVRATVVRLPPIVHSTLDGHGFLPTLIAIARAAGFSGYPGDGGNRWPACHTLDAARVYRLALEQAPAGSRLAVVGDEGIPFRVLAEAIGKGLGLPVESVPAERVEQHFGFLSFLVPADLPASGARTEELLDWRPAHPDLLADMADSANGHYFRPAG